jgi:biotin carboxylase
MAYSGVFWRFDRPNPHNGGMSRRLLLVAATTGYQTRVFAEAARGMGLDVTLATDRCHVLENPWGDDAIPVRFDDPYTTSMSVLGVFDAVIAVGDRPALIAALAARRLGLRFHPPEAVEASRNKFLARERFRAAGLPVPKYSRHSLQENPEAVAANTTFPCVLKPLGLSASRGVIRANDAVEFVAAFQRIRRLLELREIAQWKDEGDRYVQVESYIPGREFALEGYMRQGRLRTLALFDKPDPLEGPFFEETIYVTPSREPADVQDRLVAAAQRAATALALTDGPIHAEMRCDDDGVWMLEVAPRPIGGLCAQSLRFNGGIPLEQVLLRNALGDEIGELSLDGPAAGVMMIPIPSAGLYESVHGLEEAAAVPCVEGVEITAKQGQLLVPLPEGASYLGFLFARGRNPSDVEHALRTAHSCLKFTISPALPVL